MDNKLVIQLLTSKTEEIQSLLKHFANEPEDLYDSIELLESRIQGLSQDFKLLKKNCTLKPNKTIVSNEPEEMTFIATEPIQTNKTEVNLKKEITTSDSIESKNIIHEELPIIEDVIDNKQILEDKKEIETSRVTKNSQTEHIQLIGETISSHKLADIQSAIGINDRFLFTRELFENNVDEYNTAISFVNETAKFESVMNWIKTEKKWDLEDPTVAQFIEITKRKF